MKRQRGEPGGTTFLMKREPKLVSPPWNRSTDYLTKDSHIRLFHSVLLLVENDDPNKYKGYNWGKLKRAIGKSVVINNSIRQNSIFIPDNLSDNSIYFKESNNIAANFIKSLRQAFAQNYVRYIDEKDMIEICLPTYDKKSIRLRALISYRKLNKLISVLNSQINKTIKMELLIRLLFLFCTALLTFTSFAAEHFVDGIYYKLTSKGAIVTRDSSKPNNLTLGAEGTSEYSGSIFVPEIITVDGISYTVYGIDNQAFEGCIDLEMISLPTSISEMGMRAFLGCKKLRSITIPNKISEIPYGCFIDCSSLKDIILPSSLKTLGEDAFFKCTSLLEIELPNSLVELGGSAFYGCSSLNSIIIPNSVEKIGYACFSGCSNLSSLSLPNGLNEIKHGTFGYCTSLSNIDLPDALHIIGEDAFIGCTALKKISIPNGVNIIPQNCFRGCTNLVSIYLPDGITELQDYCFYAPGSNLELHLPTSIREVGKSVIDFGRLVFYNGEFSCYAPSAISGHEVEYIILDGACPTLLDNVPSYSKLMGGKIYVYDKEIFLQKNSQYDPNCVITLGNLNVNKIILEYSGYEIPIDIIADDLYSILNKIDVTYTAESTSLQIKDAGVYSDKYIMHIRHDNWVGNLPISYNVEVLKAHLDIEVDNYERKYGEENPNFTFRVRGFKGEDNLSNSLSSISYICSANTKSEVGDYQISLSGESKNYDLNIQHGTLHVTQAPIILSVHNQNRVYGETNPVFTCDYEGLKFSENIDDVFTNKPTLSSSATRTSDVGTYPIVVKDGTSKNYFISNVNEGTLEITKAPATLKVLNATRNYGQENPQFSFSVSNLRNGDNASCVTVNPTYLCDAGIESQCGSYTINAKDAESKNYTFEYVPGTLTITKVPLTLVAGTFEREYGEVNPELTYTARGLVASDELDTALTQLPLLSTTANAESHVGSYRVSISGAASNNYNISYESGILDVTKAPLKIKSADATSIYGDELPQLKFDYDGFKLSDSETTAFISLPTSRIDAFNGSSTGQYTIYCEGGEARDYDIVERQNGILTVSKAPLTLTSDNKYRSYGEPNPDFSYTLSNLRNNDDESCISIAPQFKCDATAESDCGVYTITPSNASAMNYEISYLPSTLTVTKSPLNISVKDCSRGYGDPNPKFELIYSGFRNGDNETSLSKLPEIVCEARPNSPVGYYDINLVGGESPNYDITLTPGILTVEKATLTISAKNVSRHYGKENPIFEPIYMGFKNNDDANVLFKQPICSSTANVKSPVGDYPILVANASAQNYAIVYEPGVLSVTKAPLVATVQDVSRVYGDCNPSFSLEYTGFLNGDDYRTISGSPQFKTDANTKSNVGEYKVVASGASSANYGIQYIDGTITITPKQISASVGNYNRPYGTANPSFSVIYNGFVNGDTESAISTPTIATCEASIQSALGNYPIVLTGGRGQNYEVSSYTNGVLTVERATQTIEWNQDLTSVNQYDQVELAAYASSGLPITYDIASNNVVDVYTSGDKTYLDCYGTGTVTIRAYQAGNENYYPSETITNRVTVMSEGGVVDPNNPEISINVSTPGTLSSKIATSKKYQIKSLTVSGYLNGTDIRYLREMAGRDVNSNTTTGILEKLNLSHATIVTGGDYYYTLTPNYTSGRQYTSNNSVSDYMFFGCATLTNLTLPENCTKIGDHAFDGCSNLSNIIWSDDILSIGAYAFNDNISLTRISVPKNTSSIGDYAFSGCNGLNKLILSSSVESIGSGILNNCPNIEEISLDDSNLYYSTEKGVLYNKELTSIIIYPAGKKDQTFEIPDDVTEIKPSAFYGVSALNYLFLPESLIYIGADAFKGCGNLVKIFARPVEPAECANCCFDAVSMSNCTLYVPRWSYNAYWAAPVWADFLKIEPSNDLSTGGNITKPDYCFEITETTLSRGKCTYIPVSMNNVDPVVGFMCDIVLPDGISLYEDASGSIEFKTGDRFPNSQRIESRVQSNGDVRLLCSSNTNEPFYGTEGILFYIPLFITDLNVTTESVYKLTIRNIEFTKKNQSGYFGVETTDIVANLTVGQYSLGDANGDGRITGTDAVIAKAYILGDEPSSFVFKAADLNFDGKISITDVVLITDEFLAQNKKYSRSSNQFADVQDYLTINHISGELDVHKPLTISLREANRFTALQLDVTIPEGTHIKDLVVGDNNSTSHSLRYYQHTNGLIRIFIYSDNNEPFENDQVLTIQLESDKYASIEQTIIIDDVLAVEIANNDYIEVPIGSVVASLTETSSIDQLIPQEELEIWTENSTLFIKSNTRGFVIISNLTGLTQRININPGITDINLIPGMYIVNNQKIIIK